MVEKAKATKKASVKKSSAAKAAQELENLAVDTALDGAEDALDGMDDIDVARAAARVGVAGVGLGASDLTRAEDAALVAARVAQLSQVVGAAGEADIAQGAEMLATSEDIDVMAAVVGLMGEEDLERGLELARLSGELETVGEVMERMGMPVLAAFLADRGEILQDIAVEVVLRLGSTRALAQALAASGSDLRALGENEVGEGLVRMVAAEEAAAPATPWLKPAMPWPSAAQSRWSLPAPRLALPSGRRARVSLKLPQALPNLAPLRPKRKSPRP
ncbi:MAG: hypothetical protein IPK16_14910 [Anaerolineales bacterium]|nr:hypothetical protein [Anaerolineales bacterium]